MLDDSERVLQQEKILADHLEENNVHTFFENRLRERLRSEELCSFSRFRKEYFHNKNIDLYEARKTMKTFLNAGLANVGMAQSGEGCIPFWCSNQRRSVCTLI